MHAQQLGTVWLHAAISHWYALFQSPPYWCCAITSYVPPTAEGLHIETSAIFSIIFLVTFRNTSITCQAGNPLGDFHFPKTASFVQIQGKKVGSKTGMPLVEQCLKSSRW